MTSSTAQVASLESETKRFLHHASRGSKPDRACEYNPSLDELSSLTFDEFVRYKLMGVPRLDGKPEGVCGDVSQSHLAQQVSTNIVTDSKNTISITKKGFIIPPTDRMTRSDRRKMLGITNFVQNGSEHNNVDSEGACHSCNKFLGDGIAKVTLPEGWWDLNGIARDTTARGDDWQPNTKLGDMQITGSIKQCPSGLGGVYEFTLIELPPITISNFREKADRYRKQQIGKEYDEDMSDEFIDDLARKFWRRLGPTMEPSVYGADMNGSFMGVDHACGWNINQLDTCLQLLRADEEIGEHGELPQMPGVTTAYLYFGMWGSVFAAHSEDMNLLSINYLHAGSPKYWYSIAPEDTYRFESLAASHFGGAASNCPDFLRHKRYLLSPAILKKAGIKFTTQIQRPGDAIITMPGCYHFGFNTGFNIAESTNFAVPEWVPVGCEASVCNCHPHSVRIDMYRFKQLLKEYDEFHKKNSIRKRISYTKWAIDAATRRRRKRQRSGIEAEVVDDSPLSNVSYNRGIPVEIAFMIRGKNSNSNSIVSSNKKNKQGIGEWHVAQRVKSSTFRRNTPVLCMLNSEVLGEPNKRSLNIFAGKITEVLDDYVRIHFPGMLRTDDIWLKRNSPNLFFDEGLHDAPSESKEELNRNRKGLNIKKNNKKQKK